MDRLREIYYNTKTGFLSLNKLWQRVKEEGIPLSQNDVKRFLEQQKPYELTKQVVKPKEFSNVYADHVLQSTQLDIMIYDRFEFHHYKYVLGIIDVYSRYVGCRAMTNMRMETVMEKVQDIFDNDFHGYPENINCDNQFNVPAFVDFFTSKGTHLWFSQPSQPFKNAVIERFNRTIALLLQRMREGHEGGLFDWPKALPDAVENYNSTYHRTIKAKPIDVLEGKKENPVERKVVETVLAKGDKVRIKHKRGVFEKGDVETFSRDIYIITAKKGQKNTLKNLKTGEELKRTYTDNELDQTFAEIQQPKQREEGVIELEPNEQDKQNREAKIKRRLKREIIEPELELIPIQRGREQNAYSLRNRNSTKKPEQSDFIYT
jgi:hypothetical protein